MLPPEHPHIAQLPETPRITLKDGEARKIAQGWISALEVQLESKNCSQLSELFHQNSWWRDMLGLDWEFHTMKGLKSIEDFIARHQPRSQLCKFRLPDQSTMDPAIEYPIEGLSWVTATFSFESRVGRGSGVLYLTQAEGETWKAYSMYTALQELKGYEEPIGPRRAEGTTESMPGGLNEGTWSERRRKQVEFVDKEPVALIVGAGQAGLNLGARLQSLGISCLLIEKNERVGDNWRNRYRTLVTHDHAETCHMAYLPFPKNWPKYSSKDKLADWLEAYAKIMELNIWLSTKIQTAKYDDAKMGWTVHLTRAGNELVLRPKHIIWCGGLAGVPKMPDFPGQSQFDGMIYHASQHTDASQYNAAGKKVVVVGTGNSGHDISQDFCEHGAEVTMVQRRGTYVLTAEKGLPLLPESLGLEDNRLSIDEKDVASESLPWPVTLALCIDMTRQISAADKETLDGLENAGFKVETGLADSGILWLFVTRGGGYYIDFGCSQLIVDGKIKIKQCSEGISNFDSRGILLKDGSYLEADIVVLATGYHNMETSVRITLGDEVADRCNNVWGLDEEGEIKTMWRRSGHPGFWFMGGSLSLCRIYSKFVALQICAIEAGIVSQ